MLRSGLVINKCIFNSVILSFLIFCIFLIAILITILIFLIFLILLLIRFLCIYYYVAFYLSLPFSSSPSSSLFLILFINIRIYAFYKGLYLKTPKPGLKALIYFKDISLKAVLGVSNKVLSGTKYAFIFGTH